jgi:chromosome segregation ATPase
MPIKLDALKDEKAKLKSGLRELEQKQRKLEAELKKLRQLELQTKRQIEALDTLIDVQDKKEEEPVKGAKSSAAAEKSS